MADCPHITNEFVQFSIQGKLIYKDQCTKCFVEAKSEEGIDVCLKCFNGSCVTKFQHSLDHFNKSKHPLTMRIRVTEVKPEQPVQEDIQKMAIGKPGGFTLDQPDLKVETQVFCFKCNGYVNSPKLDGLIQSIKSADSAFKKSSIAAWEHEIIQCEHTLTIQQYPAFKIASQDLAKCNNCDLSNNLWLCLICGNLACGRKNYDGTGGNNHGIEHFKITSHPLVVKLGTITPEGDASIHCYACDEEVLDNFLKDHLANFGIEVEKQLKTEKTIAELTIDANLTLQLSKILEEGRLLIPLFGGEFTGIDNIGNSCYMNSVIQAFFHIEEFKQQYFTTALQHLNSCSKFPISCYRCQMSKLAFGLISGEFCEKKEQKFANDNPNQEKSYYQDGIKLYDFKELVAKGNKEFLSNHQQDALEYLQILFSFIQKGEKQENLHSLLNLFEHKQVSVMRCTGCDGYKQNSFKTSDFKIPVETPTAQQIEQYQLEQEQKFRDLGVERKTDPKKEELPEYPTTFKKCLQILEAGEAVQINCPKCMSQQIFTQRVYFRTFPKYLIIPVNRFVLENWVPKKLNALIEIDEMIDLKDFQEPKINEDQLLKEQQHGQQQQQQKGYSQDNVDQIMTMGFSANRAKRALMMTGDNLEAATMWIMENMDDASLDDPIVEAQQQPQQQQGKDVFVSQENVEQIMMMDFTEAQARLALKKTDNNIERAIDYIFNHDMNEELAQEQQLVAPQQQQQIQEEVGSSKYSLYAAIVHLGRSVHCGHYVTYIKLHNKWILFNDSKVAETNEPVLGKGYIYILKRID